MLERIVIDPEVMGGLPCIRDTRIPVSLILKLLSNKMTIQAIIDDYSELAEEDILASLKFAEWSVSEKTLRINI